MMEYNIQPQLISIWRFINTIPNANQLWAYYMQVITWVKTTFKKYRKEMKGLDWGAMFDEFGSNIYDTEQLESRNSSTDGG